MPSYTQYKRQMAVLDADDSEIESWITVRGNHIPIMKGQSKGDAVKAFIEKKKHNLVENHKSLIEATELEKRGYFRDKTPQHRAAITKSANEMGNEEKNLEELMQFGEKEANTAPTRKQYDPDFETVRKGALNNYYLYGGKYTQRSKQAAYKEYKHDMSSEENKRAANKWVNSELVAKQSKPSDSMGRPPKKKYEGPTLKEMENSGVDVSDLRHELNSWYYGFYVNEARKKTPQQLVDWMEDMLATTTEKRNLGEIKIQNVFPDLIQKVKGFIKNTQEGTGKSEPTYRILHRPEYIKEFAEQHNLTEKVAKKAYEKFGDAFYKVMEADRMAGIGLAINHEDYELADVEKWLKDHNKH